MKRDNNFDIVRLLLAESVVLFHAHHVSNQPELAILPRLFSGEFAVEGFFAISGFLIFASYERALSLGDYIVKRAARILPGYWLATALALAISFAYGCFHVGRFLFANLTFAGFLAPSIPGLFDTNPQSQVNGALWTIKVEVMFYIAVPFIVWFCRKLHRDTVLIAIFVLSVAYRMWCMAHGRDSAAVQLPGQLSFFMVGALIHYHLPRFTKYAKFLGPLALGLAILAQFFPWFVLRPLSIPVLVLTAALVLPVVKGPTRWGDFSYGTYVLHWPILQVLIAQGLFAANPWLGTLATLLLVAVCAVISWFTVEKPALDFAHNRLRSRAQRRREVQTA